MLSRLYIIDNIEIKKKRYITKLRMGKNILMKQFSSANIFIYIHISFIYICVYPIPYVYPPTINASDLGIEPVYSH